MPLGSADMTIACELVGGFSLGRSLQLDTVKEFKLTQTGLADDYTTLVRKAREPEFSCPSPGSGRSSEL
jgi:hypothetical protein